MIVRVKSCHIYPLKSAGGSAVDFLTLAPRGPLGDRRWMLVRGEGDDYGRFISQRDAGFEKLATVKAGITPDGLGLQFPDGQEFHVPFPGAGADEMTVTLWKDSLVLSDAGDDAARMFSDFFGQKVRLVHQRDHDIRPTDPDYSRPGDETSLADGFSLLVTSVSSLETLNAHIKAEEQVNMARFRPNIVIEGLPPFAEDTISGIQVGECVLDLVKPCARCKITTIDQASGDPMGREPLRTLGKLRKGNADGLSGVFFGMNAQPRFGTGGRSRIEAGAEANILQTRDMHPALAQARLNAQSEAV